MVAQNIKRYVTHYLYGCFAQGWNSASLTLKGYVTLTVGNSVNPEAVPHIDWHALIYMWAVAFFLFGVIDYFAKHPLPESISTETTVTSTVTTKPTPTA